MRSLIKDVERGNILDSILEGRDSILKEKELQISFLDTISKKKTIQINMLSEKLNQRTDELNLSYIDLSKKDKKIRGKNRTIKWLGLFAFIETALLIMFLR